MGARGLRDDLLADRAVARAVQAQRSHSQLLVAEAVEDAVSGVALIVSTDSRVVPADDEMGAAEVAADERVEEGLGYFKKALAQRAKRTEVTQDYVLTSIMEVMNDRKGKGKDSNPNAVLKGAELLGRHLAMFTDRLLSTVTINMEDDELDAHVRRLAERLGVELPKNLITPKVGLNGQ